MSKVIRESIFMLMSGCTKSGLSQPTFLFEYLCTPHILIAGCTRSGLSSVY